jgi:anti-sigma regulatory factor (Ser/Thr protein kinase)
MDSNIHLRYKANERSYFAILKKEIHALAFKAGFNEAKIGKIDIVVSEMVSNLSKHAKGGEILVKIFQQNGEEGIEIICSDDGPGMQDVSKMVIDGTSTKNTLGQGLGAMKRLSDEFQVYSRKETGTTILCRLYKTEPGFRKKQPDIEIKSLLIAKPGQLVCGDGFYFDTNGQFVRLFLGDGLGHGVEANKAVTAAGEAFLAAKSHRPNEIIRSIDLAVKKTRGLVGTVAVFDLREKKWSLCGVGNINSRMVGSNSTKSYMPYNGIIGLNVPKTLNNQEIPHENGFHFIMCSDGIKTRWDLARHPGIFRYDLTIAANTIIKDFSRNTDDMSVAICRVNL